VQFLPYPLATLCGSLPKLDPSRVSYWDSFMENPWAGRNPQPDCHKCGRGHIPAPDEISQLQVEDVQITCECGSSFTLTEAFRNAIRRDRTPEAAVHLIADWVETATLSPNIGSLEPIPFRSRFAAVLRVDLYPAVPVSDPTRPLGFPGPLLAIPYWIASDGFALLTIWAGGSVPEGCRVTYNAYGSLEGTATPDWVRTIHSARRLEMRKDFDSVIALLGVATEAFARAEFLRRNPQTAVAHAARWDKYKGSKGGLPGVLERWSADGLPPPVFPAWKKQVWALRNLTFHEARTSPDEETFRSALDATLALIFGLRPAAMLELGGVSHPSAVAATDDRKQPPGTSQPSGVPL